MCNAGPFSLNESSKIQISTDILYPFCQRLLRPENQECISKIYYLRIPKLLANKILLTYFHLSEPIHKIQFNVRYPVEAPLDLKVKMANNFGTNLGNVVHCECANTTQESFKRSFGHLPITEQHREHHYTYRPFRFSHHYIHTNSAV